MTTRKTEEFPQTNSGVVLNKYAGRNLPKWLIDANPEGLDSQQTFYVGHESTIPDWFLDLMCTNVLITEKKDNEMFISGVHIRGEDGWQFAKHGDVVVKEGSGAIHILRPER